jgi:hypothetical protein
MTLSEIAGAVRTRAHQHRDQDQAACRCTDTSSHRFSLPSGPSTFLTTFDGETFARLKAIVDRLFLALELVVRVSA